MDPHHIRSANIDSLISGVFFSVRLQRIHVGPVAAADGATIAATVGASSVWMISLYMGSVSVVTTVKWFWFMLSLGALAAVLVSLARSYKDSSMQRYPEV